MTFSFYWHDYETWGTDPRRDRAAQFAGIRTDADLNVIAKPLNIYCRPADDFLPHPEACLVTGLTPQTTAAKGLCESEFFDKINRQLSQSQTCALGYNTIRFDDEFTRYGFFRNFIDPYAREWQGGNSRWDIIDLVRTTRALRPEGIEWPQQEDGSTSFRLEKLTEANGISHEGAHDALSDVYATIAMARLIKERQPRLFDYLFQLRDKRKVAEKLNLQEMTPVLHVSSMVPAALGCLTLVVPLARHPTNSNGVIVYDLRHDPQPLIELNAEAVQRRVFTPASELAEDESRIPLKTVHLNKSPVIVPLKTLTDEMAEVWQLDVAQGMRYREQLAAASGIGEKVIAAHRMHEFEQVSDPDQSLYSGGFFSDADRAQIRAVHTSTPEQLGEGSWFFEDQRLPEMLFRYRARNWPESLTIEEKSTWEAYRRSKLMGETPGASISLAEYRQILARRMVDPHLPERDRRLLSDLADWPAQIGI